MSRPSWREFEAELRSKREANARKGRAAKSAGASNEALILASCAVYERAGQARIVKAHEALRIVRALPDGQVLAVCVEPTGADLRGTVAGGRSIAGELKTSQQASLPLERRPGHPLIRRGQAADLDATHRLGGIAGVLVGVRVKPRGRPPVPVWAWLSWPGWLAAEAEALAQGRASIGVELLEKHGVRCAMLPGGAPDWLPAALEADARARRIQGGQMSDMQVQ